MSPHPVDVVTEEHRKVSAGGAGAVHPHARGEGVTGEQFCSPDPGSPPRAWGQWQIVGGTEGVVVALLWRPGGAAVGHRRLTHIPTPLPTVADALWVLAWYPWAVPVVFQGPPRGSPDPRAAGIGTLSQLWPRPPAGSWPSVLDTSR
jgi:hypothetical protein